MFTVVPSLDVVLQGLFLVFTQPSLATHGEIFVGWLMCLGNRTEFRVFEAIGGQRVSRQQRHPFDRFYNFFSRSAWTVQDLAHQVALRLVLALQPAGELHLIVDGTLLHKSGRSVWAIGWFHDAVASTKKRVATALGNKWVVLGLAVPIPGTQKYFCLPIHALLQHGGKGQAGEPDLARAMLQDVLSWFPERKILLVADGGFSAQNLLRDLDERALSRQNHTPHLSLAGKSQPANDAGMTTEFNALRERARQKRDRLIADVRRGYRTGFGSGCYGPLSVNQSAR